jgi:5-formyltetrahydrofolate cyclo-ligase
VSGAERTTEEKNRLRAEFSAARRARSPEQLAAARSGVRERVLEYVDATAGIACVAGYVPLRTEPGSQALLAALEARGLRVIVPITRGDRDLDWAQWRSDGPGAALGVDAVTAAQVVLVPALAVARDGTRLGRGGGSYDRALGRRGSGSLTVALLFDGEVVDHLPHDVWDRPVDAAATASEWHDVARNTDVMPES